MRKPTSRTTFSRFQFGRALYAITNGDRYARADRPTAPGFDGAHAARDDI
jgi:hypothetical protein